MLYRKLRGYKYQTTEHTSCILPEDIFRAENCPEVGNIGVYGDWIMVNWATRTMNIRHGYCWDGPSGPTIDTDSFMRGSLFHDAWYQLFRENSYYRSKWKDYADLMLMAHCIDDGMWEWRAKVVYWGVKTFGAKAAGG